MATEQVTVQLSQMENIPGEAFQARGATQAHENPRTASKNVRRVDHIQNSADGSQWLPARLALIFGCSSSCSCSSAFVLMLECSWPCSRAHVRARLHLVVLFEFCRVRACARVLVFRRVGKEKYMYSKHLFIVTHTSKVIDM